jgi:hypothetical protein
MTRRLQETMPERTYRANPSHPVQVERSRPKARFNVEIPASIPARKFLSFLYTHAIFAISGTESPRFLAKSHLLAALLRATTIPAGFCYQRLSRDHLGPPFTSHGLTAVRLRRHGWYRADPRGNRADVDAQFTPPVERLAFKPGLDGEADLPGKWPDPLPVAIEALRSHNAWDALWENLPDIEPHSFDALTGRTCGHALPR